MAFGTRVYEKLRGFEEEEARTDDSSRGLEDVEIAAVADSDARRLVEFRQAFGVKKAYSDYRDLLAGDEVDAVIISTPPGLHADMTVEAARQGKHIFCEKPMALNSKECTRMIEATQDAGVILQIGYVMRFSSDIGTIRDVILKGEIGRPVMWRHVGNLTAGSPAKWVHNFDLGRGLLWEESHPLDFMIWLFGNPSSAYAVAGRYKPNNTTAPDCVFATITFEGGDKALFTHSYSLPGFGWEKLSRQNEIQIDIVGPRGFIQYPERDLSHVLSVFRSQPEGAEVLLRVAWSSDWGANGYRQELEEFARCVREGRPSRVSGEEGRRVIFLLEGLLHSLETGEVCRFSEGRPLFDPGVGSH